MKKSPKNTFLKLIGLKIYSSKARNLFNFKDTSAKKYFVFSELLVDGITGGADSFRCFSETIYHKIPGHHEQKLF